MGWTCTEIAEWRADQDDLGGKPKRERPLGRSRLRWRDNIRDDMNILGVQNWREAMLDRDRWRRIINAAKTHEWL